MNIRGRFIGFFIAAIVALAAVFFGHLFLFEQWRAQQERQVHRAKILNEVAHVQRLVLEVETNFRGYLLTEQQSFLEPIRLAENQLNTALAQLAELTTTTPGLQAGVRVLSSRLITLPSRSVIPHVSSNPISVREYTMMRSTNRAKRTSSKEVNMSALLAKRRSSLTSLTCS